MHKLIYLNSYIIGYLLIHQTSCEYYRRCYNVSNYQHCLSTDLTQKTWQDAKDACQANSSSLISVTSSDIQSVTEQFRSYVSSTSNPDIDNNAMWIDVSAGTIGSFHWITGYPGTPTVDSQDTTNNKRFGAIGLNNDKTRVSFNAQTWNTASFYACQYRGTVSCSDGYQWNSVCYRKYNNESVTWFKASNRCLSMGGSLATFDDLTAPSDDVSLTSWLNITGTTRYWIGLVNQWLVTTTQDGSVVDVQYTNWQSGNPSQSLDANICVSVEAHTSLWIDAVSCTTALRFFCQAISQLPSTTATTTAPTTTRRTSTTQPTSTKPPSSPTSISVNAIIGSPDGQSSTTILATNELTSSTSTQQRSSSSSVDTSVVVGLAVGLGVPLLASIALNVVLLQRNKKLSESDAKKSQITQHNVVDKEPPRMSSAPEKVYTSLGATSSDATHHLYSQLQGATPSDSNTPVTLSQVYTSLDVSPPEDAGHVYAHLHAPDAGNC